MHAYNGETYFFDNFGVKHLSIPNNPVSSDVLALGRFVLHQPSCEAIDIAILELREETTISVIKRGWTLLGAENTALASPEGAFLLCGYPFELVSFHGGQLGRTPLIGYTARLKEAPENAKEPIDPRLDLFFYHDTNPISLDGEPIWGPHLSGTSGCSIWEYYERARELVWTPESALRIVGIQSSFLPGRFIRANSWEFVMAILRRIDASVTESGAVH